MDSAERKKLLAQIMADPALRRMVARELRDAGKGRQRGPRADEVGKLATLMAYTELSTRVRTVKKAGWPKRAGFSAGAREAAELLAHAQGIAFKTFQTKIGEARTLWARLATSPQTMIPKVREASPLCHALLKKALGPEYERLFPEI